MCFDVFCTTYHLDILETLNDEYTYTCVQHPAKIERKRKPENSDGKHHRPFSS